jgi:hypothetical protein
MLCTQRSRMRHALGAIGHHSHPIPRACDLRSILSAHRVMGMRGPARAREPTAHDPARLQGGESRAPRYRFGFATERESCHHAPSPSLEGTFTHYRHKAVEKTEAQGPVHAPTGRRESERISVERLWTRKPADFILRPCRFATGCFVRGAGFTWAAPGRVRLFSLPTSFPYSGRAAQPRGRRGYCHPQG